ncbi:DUF4145 domain-containing protein [Burkholderia sp. Ac-20353]|uniref:DUF4145 domain-containing protein n=1 Tax=Burkholderia sp. Ac-20353 TaxID=2703894 RepID=UPI00197B559C|nr:DUF4145 domain-containing protein [Burkholderia sp. Ac-20353]MBN3790441.1 DUF4145 domain-containing protein [Burkholderia sp. Ac-20353]
MNKIRNYCRSCNGSTNHEVCAEQSDTDYDGYHAETKYRIVRCLGCDNFSFRQEFHDYESLFQVGDDEWEHDINISIYPKSIEGHKEADEIYSVPEIVRKIYQESLSAFKNNLYILTGIGFRATVEAICNERSVSGKDLSARINNLAKMGLLSQTDASLLHSIRFIGNDAAHEMTAASEKSLKVALRIIDHLLHAVYIIRNLAGTLERIIDNYDDFKGLVKESLSVEPSAGPRGLIAILGRSRRRVSSDLAAFESQLVAEINGGTVDWIQLGPVQSVGTSGKPVNVQTFDLPPAPPSPAPEAAPVNKLMAIMGNPTPAAPAGS